ncbi:MAG: branched-chain amino acid ABC transporter permease [Anaerolineae bacterium]|nr:branched-chain amino acid ABC transporter permease [Anaerolineae bacterium]
MNKNAKTIQWVVITIALVLTLLWAGMNDCSNTGESCANLVQFSLNGIMVGGVYSLVALGIVIINKASGVFNFAHGYMMFAGGMLFWQTFDAPPSDPLALILGVIAGLVVLGLVTMDVEIRNRDLQQSRSQKLNNWLRTPRIQIGMVAGIVTAVVVFILFNELKHDILRGSMGALIGSIAVGLATERFAIRPLIGQPLLAAIMMTLAVGLVLQGSISLLWGSQPRPLAVFVEPAREEPIVVPIGLDAEGKTIYQEVGTQAVPPKVQPNYRLETESWLGKDLSFQRNLVWGFAIALSCFIGFVLFFEFTNVGLAMRAVAENQVLAESVGLRVRTILAVAWAIAAAMATIAGVIQGTGPGIGLSAIVIPPLALRAFPAVLLGGLESITGALVGGLVIGVVETLVSALVDSTTGQEFAPFAVLLVVLMLKPDGLFGQRRIDRV